MRSFFLLVGLVIGVSGGPNRLMAQDTTEKGPPGQRMLSFLSPADKEKFLAARKKVMEANPDLKTEGEELMKEGKDMRGGDAAPEDKQEFFEKFMAYQQKVRAAMLKDDPSLQSIFDQMDQHRSQMRAQHQKDGGGPPPPTTNAPPMTKALDTTQPATK
jgi:hypothetical protein